MRWGAAQKNWVRLSDVIILAHDAHRSGKENWVQLSVVTILANDELGSGKAKQGSVERRDQPSPMVTWGAAAKKARIEFATCLAHDWVGNAPPKKIHILVTTGGQVIVVVSFFWGGGDVYRCWMQTSRTQQG